MSGFGVLLKELRETRGVTQKTVADELRKNVTVISHLERGGRSPSSRNDVIALGRVLQLSPAELDALLLAADFAPLEPANRQPDSDVEDRVGDLAAKLDRLARFYAKLNDILLDQMALRAARQSSGERERLINCLLDRFRRVLDPSTVTADRVSILLPGEQLDTLELRWRVGPSGGPRTPQLTPGPQGPRKGEIGLAGLTYFTRRTEWVRDAKGDPRFQHPDRLAPYCSVICAPLLVGGECVGVISIDSRVDGFDETDMRMASMMARGLATLLRALAVC